MKLNLKLIVTAVFVTLAPVLVQAQENESAHESGLPTSVYLQAVNFVLYAILIVYIARKPVREYFSGRKEKFNAALAKAAAAKSEAESRKRDIQNKIDQLQKSAGHELSRAKAEAQDLQVRMLKDADDISANLRTEAGRTATFEIERAKNELRDSLLNQAVLFSAKLLKEKMAEGDQQRLQAEFIEKIGAQT